jgi:DNA-binding CsgD family transcriptional regulator
MVFDPVFQYNRQNIHRLLDICDPLKKHFGITHFGYFRLLDDGRYIIVSNKQSILELTVCNDYLFRTEYASQLTQDLYKGETNKIIWPTNIKDETIEVFRENGLYNGFNIIREREGTLECYWFGTDKEHPLIETLYKNHSSILEKFVVYFHKIGHELCDTSDNTRQGISLSLRKNYPVIKDMFEGTNPWEKETLAFNLLLDSKLQNKIHEIAKMNHLTSREFDCLFHLSAGRTAKEIALALNISPRTVEAHIDKIRVKTVCTTQKEIIQWFDNKFSLYF